MNADEAAVIDVAGNDWVSAEAGVYSKLCKTGPF